MKAFLFGLEFLDDSSFNGKTDTSFKDLFHTVPTQEGEIAHNKISLLGFICVVRLAQSSLVFVVLVLCSASL